MDRLDDKALATVEEKPGIATAAVTLLVALALVALVIFVRFYRFYTGF